MNLMIVSYLLGRLSIGLSAVFAIPLMMACYYQEWTSMNAFFCAITVALILGFGLQKMGAFDKNQETISIREGITTVVFAWFLIATLSAIPYIFLDILDPVSAFFESMSGLTTTGATALVEIEGLPYSLLFWRSFTHWIGGIGIIVLFIALLPQISGSAVHLFNAEVSGFSSDKILPRIKKTALALFYIYLTLTVTEMLVLMLCGLGLYDALNHSLSTIATGGFSIYNDSVAHFNNPTIEYVIGIFMLLAGGNFALYYAVTQHGIKVLWKDDEFKCYLILVVTITLAIVGNLVYVMNYSVTDGLRYSFFQVASFASTTGFVSYDYDSWPSFSKVLLGLMYFTGGCAGSTAGGIKISRFVVLIKMIGAEIKRTLHPNMVMTVIYNRKLLPIPTLISISRFFILYVATIVVLSILLAATGVTIEEAIFGVASCVSSVGPAFGTIGAVGNFAHIPPLGKIILTIAMLLGRLELFTFLVLLRSEFWKKTRKW